MDEGRSLSNECLSADSIAPNTEELDEHEKVRYSKVASGSDRHELGQAIGHCRESGAARVPRRHTRSGTTASASLAAGKQSTRARDPAKRCGGR